MNEVKSLLELLSNKAIDKNRQDVLKKIKSEDFINFVKEFRDICDTLDVNLLGDFKDIISKETEINLKISRALSKNYSTMYYVNINTGNYVGYSTNQDYKSLNVETNGNDFFVDSLKNAKAVIYPEDYELVVKTLTKENLINNTKNGEILKIYYRLLVNGTPTYVSLKGIRIDNDENIIIGISNLDSEQRRILEYREMMENDITFTNIALALARNYFYIYYVNVNNNNYIEYNIDYENQELHEVDRGQEFFEQAIKNTQIYLVPKDREKFLNTINKKNLLAAINSNKIVRMNYQQYLNDKPVYVEFTAMSLSSDYSHILIAISNIDDWKKQENKYNKKIAQEKVLARTDALTGALNKYSYKELEKKINKAIKNNDLEDISVVMCDINDLKIVNDTLGHEAGDKYIKSAYKLIKKIFKHSEIFRIGGDEFALILSSSDYYIRDYLYKEIIDENNKNKTLKKVTVAVGMADFDKDKHHLLADVFEDADIAMYEYKAKFKKK